MSTNPLTKLASLGQSVWLDLIRRNMLTPGGEMQKLIENDGVRGVTSNPAIFEKAINGSSDYDNEIRALGKQGKNTTEIYESLCDRRRRPRGGLLPAALRLDEGRTARQHRGVAQAANDTDGRSRRRAASGRRSTGRTS
jgi:hypothetical protein